LASRLDATARDESVSQKRWRRIARRPGRLRALLLGATCPGRQQAPSRRPRVALLVRERRRDTDGRLSHDAPDQKATFGGKLLACERYSDHKGGLRHWA
jgi:hypothetical protein